MRSKCFAQKSFAFLTLVSFLFSQSAFADIYTREESGGRFIPVVAAVDWTRQPSAPAFDGLLSPHESFFGASPLSAPTDTLQIGASSNSDYWAQVREKETVSGMGHKQRQESRKKERELLRQAFHERQRALHEAHAQAQEIAKAIAIEKEIVAQKTAAIGTAGPFNAAQSEAAQEPSAQTADSTKKIKDKDPAQYGFRVEDNTQQIQDQLAALDGVEANIKKQLADAEAQTTNNVTAISNATLGFTARIFNEIVRLGVIFKAEAFKENIVKGDLQSLAFDRYDFISNNPIRGAAESLLRANLLGSVLTLSETGDIFKKAFDLEDILNRWASREPLFYSTGYALDEVRNNILRYLYPISDPYLRVDYWYLKLSPGDFGKVCCINYPTYDPVFAKQLFESERRRVFPDAISSGIQTLESFKFGVPYLNPLPEIVMNALANEKTKDHFKSELNYISSLRSAAEMGISLASDKFQSLVQEMVVNPFQKIYDGLMEGPGYFLKEIFKNTFNKAVSALEDTMLGGAEAADIEAYSHAINIPFPANELDAALRESSDLLFQGIDPAAAPPSGQGLSGKQARTYLLNGIRNDQPIGSDNPPEYTIRLEDLLRDQYGFSDTEPIGLFQTLRIPNDLEFVVSSVLKISNKNLETILSAITFLEELWPLSRHAETDKVTSQIKLALELGQITGKDSLNLIAYSGGGSIAVRAANNLRLLPLHYNAFFYGAPLVPPAGVDLKSFLEAGPLSLEPWTIPNNISNILPLWGSNDAVKILSNLIPPPIYSGNLFDIFNLEGYYHSENADAKHWDYYSIQKNNKYNTTYIDELANRASIYFSDF